MVVFQGKPRDAVVRIGNDARAARKFAHFEPLRRDFHVGARANRRFRIGVQHQFEAERVRRALARVSSGVAPMPPKLKTRSPEANVRLSVAVMRSGTSPRYLHQWSLIPRKPRIEMSLAKCLSSRLPRMISSPMTIAPTLTPASPYPGSVRCAARPVARGRSG